MNFQRRLVGVLAGLGWLLCLGWAAFAIAATEKPPEKRVKPGTSAKILLDERAEGFRRSYVLHVPAGWQEGEPRPLVIALHGGLATAKILEKQTAFSQLADEHGFFVLYPNGLGIFSLLRHWNGGFCCARALKVELDDVGFVDRVMAQVMENYTIDPRRVYVVGYSNGGFLAYWYAAVRADKLAGLGIWASSIGSLEKPERSWRQPPPIAPLPTLIAHGLADQRLPFEKQGARGGQQLLGAVGSAEFWVEANGCETAPEISSEKQGAIERREWCRDSAAPVTLLAVSDWGHEWPGPKRTTKRPVSDSLHGFHLAREIWEFFDSTP